MMEYNLEKFINIYHVQAKKSFGQNFINNQKVIDKIINAFSFSKYQTVLEIGPGLGALTLSLIKKHNNVICCESDKDMFSYLCDITKNENVKIVCSDFRRFSFKEHNITKPLIISNLPYNLTKQLIMYSLENNPIDMGFMVQDEVAKKYQYVKGKKENDVVGLLLNMLGDVSVVCKIDRSNFTPSPNVDSAFIKIENLKKFDIHDYEILQILFKEPNKTIKNNIKHSKLSYILEMGEDEEFSNFLQERCYRLSVDEHQRLLNIIKQKEKQYDITSLCQD